MTGPGTRLRGLRLGAPGVYPYPRRAEPAFSAVRLDVAGFVGVALRGPVDTPVPVSSWTDYRRRFGGFEGPVPEPGDAEPGGPDRLLPYAVQAYFAQGGALAYVVRVAAPEGPAPDGSVTAPADPAPDGSAAAPADPVPDGSAACATARFELVFGAGRPPLQLAAADEGSWGNRLAVSLEYEVSQRFRTGDGPRLPGELDVPPGVALPAGSLLRIRRRDLPPAGVLHRVTSMRDRTAPGSSAARLATIEPPLPVLDGPDGRSADIDVGVVTGVLVVSDGDPGFARDERLAGLGLHPGHPRFAGGVLRPESAVDHLENGVRAAGTATESLLVRAVGAWDSPLAPSDGLLAAVPARPVHRGIDRWEAIDRRSFFDADGAAGDPLDERARHRGVDAMGRVPEIGLLCVPDIAWRWQGGAVDPEPPDPPTPCAPPWERPAAPTRYALPPAPPARLDVADSGELAELLARQLRCVEVAELRHRFVVLLDVPAGLAEREIARWRARFDSSYVAAYHPWLGVPRVGDRSRTAVYVPPSAFAAGIIAARELRLGLSWGPANELAAGAVLAADDVTDVEHDELHLLGVNVYRAERDGFRLTAARTLSRDPDYRQLSVRRLMTMLALALERQSQWLVFEPHNPDLRSRLTDMVTQFLRGLHRRGAFAGDSEEESFFVRCDDRVNPGSSQASGRLIAEVGVAPAVPLEYLVLRIAQDTDGGVQVEAGR